MVNLKKPKMGWQSKKFKINASSTGAFGDNPVIAAYDQ
jgi:hypothetical protein